MAGDRRRPAQPDPGADRLGQDPGGVPVGSRPPDDGSAPAHRSPVPRPLHLPAASARGRHREEPADAAGRHRPGGGAARRARARAARRDAHRRHIRRRTPSHPDPPARRPDHDARVALPDAHLAGAGAAAERPLGDRGRDPRDGRLQARRAPRAVARTSRRDRARASTADRPVRDPASPRGDRAFPGRTDLERSPSRDDRGRRDPQADGGRGRRAGGGHGGPLGRRRDAAADAVDARAGDAGHRAASGVDLAGDPSPGARADPGPPLDDRVRERPAAGGTPRRPPERARRRGARAGPSRLDRARAAAAHRGPAQARDPEGDRRDELARARDRHGRGRPRDPGRVAGLGGTRAPADRSRRPSCGRSEPRQGVPQVPWRPARGDGRRAPDAAGCDRGDALPAEPARRGRAADRRDVRDGRVGCRGSRPRAAACGELRGALGRLTPQRPRSAGGSLPLRRVRRAPAADRLGPPDGHAPGARGCRQAGDRIRRDDPRPRAVRRVHGRRSPRGRARRGDGVREPARRGVHARRVVVADRGHHARPRRGLARAWRAGQDAVLARRQAGAAARARPRDRRRHPRALVVGARRGRRTSADRVRTGRARRREPHRLPGRPAGGDRRGPRRSNDRGRTVPRRDRRLACVRAVAVRRAGARAVGDGDRGPARRTLRTRRPGAVERRRHRDPPARVRGADPGRGPAVRSRRDRGARGRPAPRDRAVHDDVPGGGRPCAPAPPPDAGATDAAVAAAAARRGSARGRLPSPHVPHPARGHARGPARRVRRARAEAGARRRQGEAHPRGPGRHHAVVAVRAVPAVPLGLRLHVRGGRTDGRAARRRALARSGAPARAPRRRGPARAHRPGRARRARARAAAPGRRAVALATPTTCTTCFGGSDT